MKSWIIAGLLAFTGLAQAQNPRVLLDTDRGPLMVELDAVRAPNTSANFLRYVDDGRFNHTLFHRVVKNFVVQGGGFKADGSVITKHPTVNSERNNGLLNIPGSLAVALSNGSNGQPNINSGSSDYFINTGTNTSLDANFTVFGRVIFGLKTLEEMNNTPVFANTETPIRSVLVRRAVRTTGFPILDLHTGAWFDPAKAGRGLSIEIGNDASSETGPLIVVYWYDYANGDQIWMNGAAPFSYGASEVTIPMQITDGGQFGQDFNPASVTSDPNWGSLTLRFTSCNRAEVTYTSAYGNGSLSLQRLTLPANSVCNGN